MSNQRKSLTVHSIIIGLIRLILFLTFIYAATTKRDLVEVVSLIALFTTFIPYLLELLFRIKIPSSIEIIYLMFLYGLLTAGEVRGFYSGLWWWEILMTLTASFALGFVGLSIMQVLYKEKRININPLFASIVIFSFAVSIGVLWEIFEFTLDALINSNLQKNLIDTMQDLAVNVLGGLIISIMGFYLIKNEKSFLISKFVSESLENNLWILGSKKFQENPREIGKELIKKGESEKVEFKSSFRFNIYTKEFDKRLELSVLKTIVAFLNTNGGNLVVGINDLGKITGLEKDGFISDDKLNLHLTNLIKSNIGNEFIPFIKSNIINIEDKKVLLINCERSKKRVFLKTGIGEEFYIRNGPASVKLDGNSLLDYIENRFSSEKY